MSRVYLLLILLLLGFGFQDLNAKQILNVNSAENVLITPGKKTKGKKKKYKNKTTIKVKRTGRRPNGSYK